MRRALVVALLLLPSIAAAHQSSSSYSTIQIASDGEISYTLALNTRDLYEALGLPGDRDATAEEIHAGEGKLYDYVFARLRLTGENGTACEIERTGQKLVEENERRVELRFVARCPRPGKVYLDYDLFFDLDPRHTGWVTITQGGTTIEDRFKKGEQRRELSVKGGLGLIDFIESGIEHIFTGYDHICFLIGLLLIAAIRRKGSARDVWEPRGLKAGVLYVLKIVTAFTIAHSITLILAALDVIQLPSRFVESAIAASIVYVAVENVLVGDPKYRWPLTFGFGLVHGLGFASVLRSLLPPKGVIVPLLAFNVGIEIGQVAIVSALYPLMNAIANRDANRYRRLVVLGGSAMIGILAAFWLIERALAIKLFHGALG